LRGGVFQQTDVARRLAAWAAILAVPTAVAGIYGMNFEHMPEPKWEYGYYMVLGSILGICGVLYARFRRNGWLEASGAYEGSPSGACWSSPASYAGICASTNSSIWRRPAGAVIFENA
jgi:hypothetical protein